MLAPSAPSAAVLLATAVDELEQLIHQQLQEHVAKDEAIQAVIDGSSEKRR